MSKKKAVSYPPQATSSTVAVWIVDQVRRGGPLTAAEAEVKVALLSKKRFITQVGRDRYVVETLLLVELARLTHNVDYYDTVSQRFCRVEASEARTRSLREEAGRRRQV